MKYIFSLIIGMALFVSCEAQECREINISITRKFLQNAPLNAFNTINEIGQSFLKTFETTYLDQLKCPLENLVLSEDQIQDRGELLGIIDDLKANVSTIKNINARENKSKLRGLSANLDFYEKTTNELYVKYMQEIDENTTFPRGKKPSAISPDTIFPPKYESFLKVFKADFTPTRIINTLLTQKKLSGDPIKARREAQTLYNSLNQLEDLLVEANKNSAIGWNNKKRTQQIALIKNIKDALVTKYGEKITFNTTLLLYFKDKLAIASVATEKNAVIFAAVAHALNTIVQRLNDIILAVL